MDYKTETYPVDNLLYPVMHKRKAYRYEQEVRAVIWSNASNFKNRQGHPDFGLYEEVDLDMMIQEIVVHPASPTWFFDVVCDVSQKYRVGASPKKSALSEPPIL